MESFFRMLNVLSSFPLTTFLLESSQISFFLQRNWYSEPTLKKRKAILEFSLEKLRNWRSPLLTLIESLCWPWSKVDHDGVRIYHSHCFDGKERQVKIESGKWKFSNSAKNMIKNYRNLWRSHYFMRMRRRSFYTNYKKHYSLLSGSPKTYI